MLLTDIGYKLTSSGISVVPVTMPDKKPLVAWKELQQRIMTADEINDTFSQLNGNGGIAIICGAISKNLEVIDFDNKFDMAKAVFTTYISFPEVHEIITKKKLPYEKTLNGGYHLFYRAKRIDGNKKLAKITKNDTTETIIETRGEGGYVVIAPTPGYKLLHGSLDNIALLTQEERDVLIRFARGLGELKETENNWQSVEFTRHKEVISASEVKTILENAGWQKVSSDNKGNDHYRRPGKKFGTSASYNGSVFYVFSTNCPPFEAEKGYNNFSVFLLLKHNGNINSAEKELLARKLITREETVTKPEEIEHFIISIINKFTGQIETKGDHSLFIKYLSANGFRRYDFDGGFKIIRIVNNIVSEIEMHHLIDFCKKKIENDDAKLNYLIKNESKFFNNEKLRFLPVLEYEFNNDTKDTMFFYFKDGYLEIRKEKIEFKTYDELSNRVIWEDQIIRHKINLDSSPETSIFELFCQKITRYEADQTRYLSLISSIGYCLHTYKNPSEAKVIVFCDEGDADNLSADASQGRTGKSLVGKAISKIRKTTIEDGRNFVFDQFAFQNVKLSTQVHFFNDCSKRFQFENLFSIITEGYTINKKNQQPFTIDFEHAPKLLITTNYTLQTDDESSKDRIFEVEFAPVYSSAHKPIDDFGKLFWIDFDKNEWRDFFLFMAQCGQFYLESGLKYYEKINLKRRKLMQTIPEEFTEFFENYISKLTPDLTGIARIYKKDITDKFSEAYPRIRNVSQKTVSKWIKKILEFKGTKNEEKRNHELGYFWEVKVTNQCRSSADQLI